jgi:predicted TIM-barrel fold metal-dependent hydrolase
VSETTVQLTSSTASDQVIEPDLPIIDCHHHLWVHGDKPYLLEQYAADLASGHKVLASVYIECSAMYRRSGPEHLRCVGEAEFVGGIAAMSDSGLYGPTRVCAGFVGGADLSLGAGVDEVLDALMTASGGRLRGVRCAANWDADPSLNTGSRPYARSDLMQEPGFREGLRRLAARGLVYDSHQYHPQLVEVAGLADAVPELPTIINHSGGLMGIGPYAGRETFANWKSLVKMVARRPNTVMKLGGLSARRCGFDFEGRNTPATAEELAAIWRPYIETCIELFGPMRCMFESNFPPDRVSGDYRTLWNALKLTASNCSPAEKRDLFCDNARRIYRID